MTYRPQMPALSFTPETLMGDLARITRKLAAALFSLAQWQVVRLRQELAIVELLIDKHLDIAAQARLQLAASRRPRRDTRVLEFPSPGERGRAA